MDYVIKKLLLILLISVSLTACSRTYGSLDFSGGLFSKTVTPEPSVKIPNLPNNVYHKRTKIPDKAINGNAENSAWIKEWETNDAHNERAINSAKAYVKKLQSTYNK